MERAKLTSLTVDRAHRLDKPMRLSDGDGLYLRRSEPCNVILGTDRIRKPLTIPSAAMRVSQNEKTRSPGDTSRMNS